MAIRTSGVPSPVERRYVQALGLSKARQKKAISLESIAETTKISIRFLRAIEAEEFEKLPGGLFSTSYIRQYAASIGFDEAELLAQYHDKTDPVEQPQAAIARKSAGSETKNWFGRWLGITAAAPRS